MGGAFAATADDPTAIFYNVAGIAQLRRAEANVKTLSVEPALAWQTDDGRFAIGGGAEYRRSHIILDRNNAAYNPFSARIADVANAHLNSDWDNSWGWNVGILFKPTPAWRLGASYRAEMTIDYKGDAV